MIERLREMFGRTAPAGGERAGRAVDVGWLLDSEKATFIWEAPRRIRRTDPPPKHAKSLNFCPAMLDYEARMFEVTCPIDVQLQFRRDDKGQPGLANLAGDAATVRAKHLNGMVTLVSPREWRHPDRPIIQFVTPYVFVTDEPVFMTQLPPVTRFLAPAWPGVLIGGRLPIHIWPRQMMWAFEWWDTKAPLTLKRGDPWFNVRFETIDPTRPVRLFEAEMTPELRHHIQGLSAVANYVNRTFSLFKTAEERRPATLLKRKRAGDTGEIA